MQKRLYSFVYAGKGLAYLIRTETQFQVHILLAFVAIIIGVCLHISPTEWALLSSAIGLVLCAEAFNTAIEQIVNWLSPEHHHQAGKIKDIAAGAVLLSALAALGVGIAIFIPKLYF